MDSALKNYQEENVVPLKSSSHRPLEAPNIRVLIIDDDADSILPLDAMFKDLGCETSYALDSRDAVSKLSTLKNDIIILDWCFNKSTGGEILRAAVKTIKKDSEASVESEDSEIKPKIVTYSSLKQSEIEIPDNEIFSYEGHWRKPVELKSIRSFALKIIKKFERLRTSED